MDHIHLIGTGVTPKKHLTTEAINSLKACRRVYHLTAFHEQLADYCLDLIDWREMYEADIDDVYDRMANVLIHEARDKPSVGFAVYGHPLVLVDTSRLVIESALKFNLSVKVVPGVSSMDVLLQHLLLDVGLSGLQVYEANQLLARRVTPNPEVACFIMQIGAFGSVTRTRTRQNHPKRFVRLRDYLLKTYSYKHPAVLITCPFLPSMELIRYDVCVGDIDKSYDLIHTGMTLYIPPTYPSRMDEDFIASLSNNEAVFKLTNKP